MFLHSEYPDEYADPSMSSPAYGSHSARRIEPVPMCHEQPAAGYDRRFERVIEAAALQRLSADC